MAGCGSRVRTSCLDSSSVRACPVKVVTGFAERIRSKPQQEFCMHKLLVLYPTGQDAKKFRPYYEQTHAALVAKLPGLKASRYSFNVKGAGDGPVPYYCVFEAEFADEAA